MDGSETTEGTNEGTCGITGGGGTEKRAGEISGGGGMEGRTGGITGGGGMEDGADEGKEEVKS